VLKVLNILKADLEAEEEQLRINWCEAKMRRVLKGLGYTFHRIRERTNIYERDDLCARRHAYLKYSNPIII
jgi:hypothetical protein